MNPRLPAIIVFALCAATPLWAASHVWTGANSNLFSDSGNWAGGSPAGDTGADLYFPTGPAVRALSNDIAPLLTVRTIAFSGTGYTINGSRINVTSSITDDTAGPNELVCDLLLSKDVTLTATQFFQSPLTLSGSISGPGGLIKAGDGRITLTGSAPNAYTGSTNVNNGVLALGKPTGTLSIPGADYVATGGSLTFASGDTKKTLPVAILGDVESEPDEVFTIRLGNASAATIEKDVGVITILDDDTTGNLLTVDSTEVTESYGPQRVDFRAWLTRPAAKPVTLHYATVDGTAKSPGDYVAAEGDVTIAPGETETKIAVTVQGDLIAEPTKTFTLRLATSDAVLASNTATCFIFDDDGPHTPRRRSAHH